MKVQLISVLDNNQEIAKLVHTYSFPIVIYLTSVYWLEFLRLNMSTSVSTFNKLFGYLEDKTLQTDKNGIYRCITVMVSKLFNQFCKHMAAKPKNEARDRKLDTIAIILLIEFNNGSNPIRSNPIRKQADTYLSELVNQFPHLLWSKNVLYGMLDAVHELSLSLTDEDEPEVFIGRVKRRVVLLDTVNERQELLREFAVRVKKYIDVSVQWAPDTVQSHLQEYINTVTSKSFATHHGVSLATECIQGLARNSAISGLTGSVGMTNLTATPSGPRIGGGPAADGSRIMLSMSNRQSYTSQVQALLHLYPSTEKRSILIKDIVAALDKAAKGVKDAGSRKEEESQLRCFHDALWKMTACLILMRPSVDSSMLFNLARAPLKLFRGEAMKTVIECWHWFLTARPDLEMELLHEIVGAWHASQTEQLGLFEEYSPEHCPLAPDENLKLNLRAYKPEVEPHDLWIRFIHERIEIAKYCSQDQIYMFTHMLQRTFDLAIGLRAGKNLKDMDKTKRLMARHISTAGTRFRLLACGMSMLQGSQGGSEILPSSSAKNILRQRIYMVALDYFCSEKTFPVHMPGSVVSDDIQIMLKFWMMMWSDRKYIKDKLHLVQVEPLGGIPVASSANVDLAETRSTTGSERPPSTMNWMTGNTGVHTMDRSGGTLSSSRDATPMPPPSVHGVPVTAPPLQPGAGGTLRGHGTRSASRNAYSHTRVNHHGTDRLSKDFQRKRWLILALLSSEIEVLVTYQNPLDTRESLVASMSQREYGMASGNTGKQLEDAMSYLETQVRGRTMDKEWRDHVRFAWDVSPTLAVYLPQRLYHQAVEKELSRLVRSNPEDVCHLPKALDHFLTRDAIQNDAPELTHVLTWANTSPVHALSLFCPRIYPSHPLTAQYAVRVLESYEPDAVLFYIQQLVQCTRWDDLGYVKEFIKVISNLSNLVAHQLIWNMQTNMYKDEDGEEKDPEMYGHLTPLLTAITEGFTQEAKAFYEREFKFFKDITAVSGIIAKYEKGQKRQKAVKDALKNIVDQKKVLQGCYLPSNPNSLVLEVDPESGIPLQSAAKAPYLAKFKIRELGIQKMEHQGLNMGETLDGKEAWKAAIFKVGDDCRQDMLALQVMELFKNIYKQCGLDLYLFPYQVVATNPGCGVIECVPDCKSRHQIGAKLKDSLYKYFIKEHGEESTQKFKHARKNFAKSLAAYSVFAWMLQIKDRHNGNLMIDNEGHFIHIDFGFMFESSPGGNIGFEPDMKIVQEYVDILGGADSPQFKAYKKACVHAYLAIKPYWREIQYLVQMMLDTQLPCFRGQTIEQLRYRLQPHESDLKSAQFVIGKVNGSFLNMRSTLYDRLQYQQNGIEFW